MNLYRCYHYGIPRENSYVIAEDIPDAINVFNSERREKSEPEIAVDSVALVERDMDKRISLRAMSPQSQANEFKQGLTK